MAGKTGLTRDSRSGSEACPGTGYHGGRPYHRASSAPATESDFRFSRACEGNEALTMIGGLNGPCPTRNAPCPRIGASGTPTSGCGDLRKRVSRAYAKLAAKMRHAEPTEVE